MNSDHKLDAPSEDALRNVEQLEDRSDLSVLYPHQATPWEGELMSTEEREAKRDKATEEITTSLRRYFALIGVLTALPLLMAGAVVASIMEVGLFGNDSPEANSILMIVTVLVGGAWVITSFVALRKVVHLFYDHALRAAPFIVTLLAMISISLQTFYILTIGYHNAKPLVTVGIVGLATVLWSIILSFALLWLWTSPRLSDSLKIAYIAALVLCIVVAAGIIGAASMFVR